MDEALACDVAIIGGGPAGLGAAIALRERDAGHIVVIEREAEAGGVPRHCAHPPYGLREFGMVMTGPTYARRLRALAGRRGVDIRTRHSVVALRPNGVLLVATPQGLLTVTARRVVLATGARETPRSARMVSGDRPLGVINTGALQACIYLEHLKPFARPVIVGTELVGLSALWTCLSHGIRPAAVIEAGNRPTARWPLGMFPRMLGVPVHFRSHIAEIAGSPRVDHVQVVTDHNRRFSIACDGVLFTGSFLPEASLMRMGPIEVDHASNGPVIDEYGRCSDPTYFAAGNVLRAIETAGWCYREGRRIAGFVADDLEGRLPISGPCVRIECGSGVKLAMPQKLWPQTRASGMHHIQLRASHAVTGTLTVSHDGKVIWSRRVSTLPERRILIPMERIKPSPDCRTLSVAIESS